MTTPAVGSAADEPTHRLFVSRVALAGEARLAWAIRAARSWLGLPVEVAPDGMRRYHADLRLRVSDHPSIVTFRKAAFVDLGPVRALGGDDWAIEVSWRAATFAPLFPVFSGTIVCRDGRLTLPGRYAPPGGALGRIADRALLHIAAKGTGGWLLAEIDRVALAGAGSATD